MKIDFTEWPLAGRLILAIITIIVVVLLGYLFVIGEKFNTLNRMKTEEYDLLQQWAILVPQVQAIETDRKQIVAMKNLFADVLRRIPNQLNMAALLDNISEFGMQSGVYFKSLKPLATENHLFYASMPIEVEAIGNYHQLATFISKLANLEQFVTFNRFNLRQEQSPQSLTIENEKLKMAVEVVVYHGIAEQKK